MEDTCYNISDKMKTIYPDISISPTVHLLLVHSPSMLYCMDFNFWNKSEESLERSNKIIRYAGWVIQGKKGELRI